MKTTKQLLVTFNQIGIQVVSPDLNAKTIAQAERFVQGA